MKKSLALAFSFVLIVGVVAGAVYEGKPPVKEDYWDNLPEAWKFNFTTFGRFGARTRSNANFQIAGWVFTEKGAKRLYKKDWPEPRDWVRRVVEKFSNPIYVYVYSYGDSMEPFDPTNFTFSQSRDSTEYSLTPDRITGFESDKEVMSGFLEVPTKIDVRETFYIHYKYGSAKAYTPGYFADSPYPEEKKTPEMAENREKEKYFNEYCFQYEGDEYCFKEYWVSKEAKERWKGDDKPGEAYESSGGARVFIVKATIDKPGDAIVVQGLRNLSGEKSEIKKSVGNIVGTPIQCNCDGPDMDCKDFNTEFGAATCFRFCGLKGFGDVFNLDPDDDAIPCENVEWEEN